MKYELLKKEYVIETLAKGTEVIVCDFKTMRMCNCSEMTVKNINSFIDNASAVFYKVVANE